MDNQVEIHTEYITLGQFIKLKHLSSTGGGEKEFLKTNKILVNGVEENRRGKKLRAGDKVTIDNTTYTICMSQALA